MTSDTLLPAVVLTTSWLLLLADFESRRLGATREFSHRVTGQAADFATAAGLRRGLRVMYGQLPSGVRRRDQALLDQLAQGLDPAALLALRSGAVAAALVIWIGLGLLVGRGSLHRPGAHAAAGGALGLALVEAYLTARIRRRRAHLKRTWPGFLSRLRLALSAGLTLEGAVRALLAFERRCSGELAADLAALQREIKSGIAAEDSLLQWAHRCGLDDAERLALTCQRCRRLGLPLAPAIRRQQEHADAQAHNRHQAWVNGLPGRISVVAMLFFMPAILIVVLLPNVLSFLRAGW